VSLDALGAVTLDDIVAARSRIAGTVLRTPLVRLSVDAPREIWLKLECLQPIGSFKLRGATNAMRRLAEESPERLASGVYTASAGNMAQGLAWAARSHGAHCSVVVPDGAPETKLEAVRRLGAEIVSLPYTEWWDVLATHRYAPLEPARFIHPVSDVGVMAGNGTIGLEIMEDLPDVDAVLVPYGGGGLSSGIAAAIRSSRADIPVYACEVETAAPLRAAFAAGHPVESPRTPTFVDGIGAPTVLAEMWPAAKRLLAGPLVVTLAEVEAAIRLLVERAAVVAEGAGAASVAAGLKGLGAHRRVVCVVSGGNIDRSVLSRILEGGEHT
jgi:threonine dehydratase